MALELVDDLRYSILELNAHAMQRSQSGQLVEAQQLLETAYIRLQSADAAVLAADAGLIDQLKATTLSNLGVVECHKKELDKSLDHLEAALAIEKRIGIFSPTTALNLCATFNALGRYEEAVDICTGAIQTLMNTNGGKPTEENKTLWAAAWHNLSVAEMNLGGDIGGPEDRKMAVLNMFKNAMRASVDLLGAKHPLTATIHESYRAARPALKKQGAYKLRDPLLPTLSTSSTNRSLEKKREKHSANLTDDEKLGTAPAYEGALAGCTGRLHISESSRRVPSLLTAVRNAQRGEHGFRPTQTLIRAQPLYLDQHPATAAAPQQSEILLQPRQREMRRQRIPSIGVNHPQHQMYQNATVNNNNSGMTKRRRSPPQTSRVSTNANKSPTTKRITSNGNSRGSPTNTSRGGGHFNSNTSKVLSSLTHDRSAGGNNNNNNGGISWSASNFNNNNNSSNNGGRNNNRSVESALIGDMWVEVDIPIARRTSPPSHNYYGSGGTGGGFYAGGGAGGGSSALRQSGNSPNNNSNNQNNNNNNQQQQQQQQYEFKAPSYGQTMHVIDPSDPIMERVAQPNTYASLDSNTTGMMMTANVMNNHQNISQQQQQQQAPHPQNRQQLPSLAQQANVFASSANTNSNDQHQMHQQQQQTPLLPVSATQPHHQQQAPPPAPRRTSTPTSQQQQQQQQHPNQAGGAQTPPIPQPPKRPPSSGGASRPVGGAGSGRGSRPSSGAALPPQQQQQQQQNNSSGRAQQQQQPQQGGGFNYLADALGSDIQEYPGLAMLSTM